MRSYILETPVDPLDYASAVKSIVDWIGAMERPCRFVVQTNVNSIVTVQESSLYSSTLQNASLSVPDGMPLVWLLRLRGVSIKSRVYGPDLMLMLCEEASKKGWRCFLYGGKPGVLERLKRRLESLSPGLQIVGAYSPPFRTLTETEDREICEMINAANPDILWVALGTPKQDIWMYEHREKLNVSVMHGVGAAFDFLSGEIRQAPRWMMHSGFEWLYRLMIEPRRLWKRYTINNALFLYYLLLEFLGLGRYRRPNRPTTKPSSSC